MRMFDEFHREVDAGRIDRRQLVADLDHVLTEEGHPGGAGDSLAWREGFIQTFLTRDIPQLGISIPPAAVRRFWTMLAHYHGQTWNASELGRSLDLSDKTVRSYLDILTGTFMVRQLQPWHENLRTRQVKAPKIYLRDSGVLHALLNLPDFQTLHGYPRVGASREGFAVEQILQIITAAGTVLNANSAKLPK